MVFWLYGNNRTNINPKWSSKSPHLHHLDAQTIRRRMKYVVEKRHTKTDLLIKIVASFEDAESAQLECSLLSEKDEYYEQEFYYTTGIAY